MSAATGQTTPQQFAELLLAHDKGRTNTRLSEQLATILAAVEDTAKTGKLTCTFEFKPQSGMASAVTVTAQIKASVPEHDPRAALYFIATGPDGLALSRNDPNQLSFADFEGND